MLERLREIISRECELHLAGPIVIGVSGGPDSLCLMDALSRLGHALIVAHFDHKLRPEAEADAREVQRIAENYGFPFELGEADVAAFAKLQALSLEEAGRTLRYRFMFELAEQSGAQAVAVAHTADDQVETVLMHFLRGAGLSGLRGMPLRALPNAWSRAIPLVRPLLSTWRAEVLAYCAEHGLEPVFDSTNQDQAFFRNRLRHELIPILETYNPAVRAGIWRMAQVLSADYAILEKAGDAVWEASVMAVGERFVAFNPAALQAEPSGLQRQIVRRAIALLRPGLRDIDFEATERALEFLSDPERPAQIDLIAGLRLVFEPAYAGPALAGPARIWLAAWEAELPPGEWPQVHQALPLPVPSMIALPGGWQLRAEEIQSIDTIRRQARENVDPFQAWVALDNLTASLEVRARRPGDRFQPLGMGGHALKISDFMINAKLPQRARRAWPLVCAGEAVVWVPGFRLGHPFRLAPDTRQAVHLRLRHVEP
jgi:tRNA(Ile)-lysidine synthase